jgi:hypothetical protein
VDRLQQLEPLLRAQVEAQVHLDVERRVSCQQLPLVLPPEFGELAEM